MKLKAYEQLQNFKKIASKRRYKVGFFSWCLSSLAEVAALFYGQFARDFGAINLRRSSFCVNEVGFDFRRTYLGLKALLFTDSFSSG